MMWSWQMFEFGLWPTANAHAMLWGCSKVYLGGCNGVDILIITKPPYKYFLINTFMHHLEFADLDPLVFSNIESL